MTDAGAGADAGERPIGTWRAAARGWRVFVPAVAAYAVVQYVLIAPDVTPSVTPVFLALVGAAYLLDVALVAAASIAASAAARGLPLGAVLAGPHRGGRIARIVGWSAVGVAVVSFVAVANALAAAVVLLAGAAMMPAVVAYRGPRAWFRPFRRVPGRATLWAVLAFLGVVVSAVADAELGFLVGGPVGAACARVVAGVIGVLILCSSAVLAERAERAEARSPDPSRSPAASVRNSA